jgi:hypothetical protein
MRLATKEHTPKEELFGSMKETVFGLGVGHRVESSYTHNLSNRVATAIIGV